MTGARRAAPLARVHGHRGGVWWANPLSPVLLLVLPTALIAWALPSRVYVEEWREPKYFLFSGMVRVVIALVLLCVGALIGTRGRLGLAQRLSWPALSPIGWQVLRRSFFLLYRITMVAYALWVLLAVRNGLRPAMLVDTLRSQDNFSGAIKDQFVNVAGVTTLIQLGIAAAVIGAILTLQHDRAVSRRLQVLIGLAVLRGFFLAERLAIIEVVLPYLVVRSARLASQRERPARRVLVRLGPVLAVPLLILGFSLFEYSRSWSFAKTTTNSTFVEYSSYRLVGYYAVSYNNGELYRVTTDRSKGLPYDTIEFVWQAPVISSAFPYDSVAGMAPRADVLSTLANPEFNSPGGVVGPLIDFGDAGGFVYYLLLGFFLGWLYRMFAAGRIFGLLLYPLFFVGLLELPRYLYWAQGRMTPAFVALLLIGGITSWRARGVRRMYVDPR